MRETSDAGFSLIELLVAMGVGLVILGGVLSLWSGAAANEGRNAERFDTVDATRNGLERMTRDVREATAVTGVTDRLVTLKLWTRDLAGATPSALHTITYNCGVAGSVASSYRCVRTDTTAGTPAVTVVDRLTSPSVFTTVAGQPNLQMKLSVLVSDATYPVVMHSGASPRNCTGALSACT
jgi:prepilin-type N-terminal cleavage/methylation domain-containing protein